MIPDLLAFFFMVVPPWFVRPVNGNHLSLLRIQTGENKEPGISAGFVVPPGIEPAPIAIGADFQFSFNYIGLIVFGLFRDIVLSFRYIPYFSFF